ncbi:MAG: hypothetical protein HRT54_13030 [Colwellia sp.]|nr:hypothetical protein [Colwellia sp.]
MNLASFPRDAFETMWHELPPGPKTLLMTSFEFTPDLFEREILPRLCGEDPKRINPTRLNHLLIDQQIKALVVVDRSTNSGLKGAFNYGLLNVGLKGGRFHPKITLMLGGKDDEQQMYISVASANISYAGWSRNTEVLGWSRVDASHIPDLIALINWIEQQRYQQLSDNESEGGTKATLANLTKALDDLKSLNREAIKDSPQLVISTPTTEHLLVRILGNSNWQQMTYYSPYWHSINNLLDVFKKQGVQNTEVKLIATLSRMKPGLFLFEKDAYENNILPYRYSPDVDITDSWSGRFCHAKIIILENIKTVRLVIGSHNATKAALQSDLQGEKTLGNIEAVLIYDFEKSSAQAKAIKSLWCNDRHLIPLTKDKLDLNDCGGEEGAPQLPPLEINVTAKPLNDTWEYQVKINWLHKAVDNSQLIIGDHIEVVSATQTSYEFILSQSMPTRTFRWQTSSDKYTDVLGTILLIDCNDPEALGYYPPISVERLISELFKGNIGNYRKGIAPENDDNEDQYDDLDTDEFSVDIDDGDLDTVTIDDPYQLYKSWFLQKDIITRTWCEQLLKSLKKAISESGLKSRDLMTYLALCQLLIESKKVGNIKGTRELQLVCNKKIQDLLIKDEAFTAQFESRSSEKFLLGKAQLYLNWWQDEHSKIWSQL